MGRPPRPPLHADPVRAGRRHLGRWRGTHHHGRLRLLPDGIRQGGGDRAAQPAGPVLGRANAAPGRAFLGNQPSPPTATDRAESTAGLRHQPAGGIMTLAIYFHPKSLPAEHYDSALRDPAPFGADRPAGRSHHSCFGPAGDLMVYEVWESQEAFEEYGKVLIPIRTGIGIDPGAPDVMPVHNIIT